MAKLKAMDEMDSLLEAELGEGQLDSAGVFTLSPEKARSKLAAHQLPGPHHWILKVIQAAVAWKTSSIEIRFEAKASRVWFDCPAQTREVERIFFAVEPDPSSAVEHFKKALWGAGNVCSFGFVPARCSEMLVWNGEQFRREPAEFAGRAQLVVWYKDAAAPELKTLVRSAAYACPVPLSLNNIEIDSLSGAASWTGCPTIGEVWGEGNFPALQCRHSERRGCLAVITAAPTMENETPVTVCWVLDGVVIEQQALDFTDRTSATVVLSAEGLDLDLSGFRLIDSQRKEDRLRLALESLTVPLRAFSLLVPAPAQHASKAKVAGLFVGSGVLLVSSFVSGLGLLFAAGVVTGAKAIAHHLKADPVRTNALERSEALGRLQKAWPDGLRYSVLPPARRGQGASIVKGTEAKPTNKQPKWRRAPQSRQKEGGAE